MFWDIMLGVTIATTAGVITSLTNKYIINNGLGQIRGGMNFPKAVFEEEKPEIIIIEGDVLEERLKNQK